MAETPSCLHRFTIDPIEFVATPVLPIGYIVNPDANNGKVTRSITFDIQDFFIDYDVVPYKVKCEFIDAKKPEGLDEITCDSDFYEFYLNGAFHYNAIIGNVIPMSSEGKVRTLEEASSISASGEVPLKIKVAFACPGCINPKSIRELFGKDLFDFTVKMGTTRMSTVNTKGTLVYNIPEDAPNNDFYELLNDHMPDQTILLPYVLTITPKPQPEPVDPEPVDPEPVDPEPVDPADQGEPTDTPATV